MSVSTLVNIETQHNEMIHDAQLDYYSRKLATASSDRTIEIFDINGEVTNRSAVLTGHEGPVWQVAWAHPRFGVLLASCSYDGSVLIHTESPPGVWTTVHAHRLHESSVNSVAWAPEEYGLILACASSDGKVSILQHMDDDSWQVSTFQDGKLGCNAVSWAPYGSGGGKDDAMGRDVMRLVTGSCDNRVRVWKCPAPTAGEVLGQGQLVWTDELTHSEPAHTDWVRDVAWAPATGMPFNTIASCGEDKAVYIWTQQEGGTEWTLTKMHEFSAPVWRLSWSVTGNVLAVSHGDDDVTLWKQNIEGRWEMVSSVEEGGRGPNQ
ncbi:WD40-repeat-containing domain protein [Tribonema minus]|uniref:WD40-repeat-containing domain protein n=1 Tax=Tribonema minus TaxID=303371 RepID=A0A836CBZ9_9STRA|nr:WD40-repeat-containing domain protein [Tribonema minus]